MCGTHGSDSTLSGSENTANNVIQCCFMDHCEKQLSKGHDYEALTSFEKESSETISVRQYRPSHHYICNATLSKCKNFKMYVLN